MSTGLLREGSDLCVIQLMDNCQCIQRTKSTQLSDTLFTQCGGFGAKITVRPGLHINTHHQSKGRVQVFYYQRSTAFHFYQTLNRVNTSSPVEDPQILVFGGSIIAELISSFLPINLLLHRTFSLPNNLLLLPQ